MATWLTPRCARTWAVQWGSTSSELELLVCPCHQSMFNVRNGAVPQFGPAPRPLPQLALGYNDQGYLIATAPYDQASRTGLLRADNMSDTAVRTKRSTRKAMGPYGQVGKIVDELDERYGIAKGGRVCTRQDLPGPLVLHVGRDRSLLVRRADRDGHLPGALLRALRQPGHLPRGVRTAPGPAGFRGLSVDGQHLVQRAWRSSDPPDAPLGGRHFRRGHHRAHGADLLHRRVPQAARTQLDHRDHHAGLGGFGGFHRVFAPGRPHLRHRAPHRLLDRASRSPSSAAT